MTEDKLTKARNEINEIDREMVDLFVRRMDAVKAVASYKNERKLPIFDKAREKEVIETNSESVCEELRDYYVDFLKCTMSLSKEYQRKIIGGELYVNLGERGYEINLGRGYINRAGQLFNLDRRVFILTDSGVPREYAERVKAQAKEAIIFTVNEGEESKSIETLALVLNEMLKFGMTRSDCLLSVGGGVVGDLGGFAASSYMRGIDFYNIPTTLLSQIDSSIGGKTGVNHGGIKNIVGSFYQPSGVIVDPELLRTLSKRQMANGYAEAIKMAICLDSDLFDLIENNGDLDEIIFRSLKIKKAIIEADEREGGLRRVLNFGHTLGHAIEAVNADVYHGECVAIGMVAMSSREANDRLIPLLKKLDLPIEYSGSYSEILSEIRHDKKCLGEDISVIYVDTIGEYKIEKISVESFISRIFEDKK